MADDVVDTIAQYDLDDDFPDYANEQNKELNQIVSRSARCRKMGLNSWLSSEKEQLELFVPVFKLYLFLLLTM